MKVFSFTDHPRTEEKVSTWWLGSADLRGITFPSNKRIATLWRKHAPDGGDLTIITDDGSNHRGVKIPRGIPPKKRQPFLEALALECKIPEIA